MREKGSALVLAAAAAWYAYQARSFETGFIADPIGPKAFPYAIGILALVAAVLLFVEKPNEGTREPIDKPFVLRGVALAGGLLAYAVVLEPIGFILATTLFVTALVELFRGRFLHGLAFGFLLSLVFFFLFTYGLALPLPIGAIFGGR